LFNVNGAELIETLDCGGSTNQRGELCGAATELGAVQVAVFSRQHVAAGVFENGDEVLQLDLGGIRRWDKVSQCRLEILDVHFGVVFEG